MEKVKISTLSKDTIILVDGNSSIYTVEDVLNDLDYFKEREIYTTTPHHASFNAESIIETAIEDEGDNMYEDWDERIREDYTDEDIVDLQKVFDRILGKNPSQNINYESDKEIEIDI